MMPRLSRQRHIALALAAGALAALGAIGLVGAPPIPVVLGVVLAVAWSVWRAPSA